MSEYIKAIAVLRRRISTQDKKIHEIKIKIGDEISKLKQAMVKDTPLFDSFVKVQDLKKMIPGKMKVIQDIKKIDNEIEDANNKMNELKVSISEKEKEYKIIYENIGSASYTAFKLNQEKLKSYENIFIDLIKQDIKSEQFNKVDISGNPDEKNIIRQFVDAAKSMYRNQKHKFILLRYPGLYRQAGKAILTTDFVEDAAYTALDEAMKPLVENERMILKLNADFKEIEKIKAGLQEKLTSMDVKGKPRKKIQEIESEITQIEEKLTNLYLQIGNLFLDQHCEKIIEHTKTTEYSQYIADLEDENKKSEEEIKRYETLISIDKVNNKIMKTGNKAEHLKTQIAKQEQELKSTQNELSRLEKQKNELETRLQSFKGSTSKKKESGE